MIMVLILKVRLVNMLILQAMFFPTTFLWTKFNAQQNDEKVQPIHDAAMRGHTSVIANLVSKHGVDPKCSGAVSIVVMLLSLV